jgi:alpha-maltose-1-phosphate synthase
MLSQTLRERGHEVIISDVASPMKLPHISGLTLYLAGAAMLRYRRKWHQGYFHTETAFEALSKQAERLLVKEQPDMVIQSGCLFGLSSPAVPYVLYLDHTHAISQAYAPWPGLTVPPRTSSAWLVRERATYHRAHRILVMSEFVRASLVHDYGVSESKVRVIGAGPNLPNLPNLSERQDDGHTVLFIGRTFMAKGGPVLLSAMNRVRQQVPHAHLLVVGVNGPSDKDVTYAGWVPTAEIATYYKRATIFALPTLREAFGLVFLEAMAYGLPCVGTHVEAVPEIIADGETGFIVPPGDDEALAERLVQLLKDPELRRRMGNAGRARQERLFTWQKVADAVEASLCCQ